MGSTMTSKLSAFGLYCTLLFYSAAAGSVNSKRDFLTKRQALQQVQKACFAYQRDTLLAIRQIFDEQQSCAQASGSDPELKKELRKIKAKLVQKEQRFQALSKALTTPAHQRLSANVPHLDSSSVVNASVSLSCGSDGQPLNLCLWEQEGNVGRKVIITDDGISPVRHEFDDGTCGLEFPSVKQADSGYWSCTLVGKNGSVFAGRVYLEVENPDSLLWFALGNGDIVALSPETSHLTIMRSTGEGLHGMAFDTKRNRIYWGTASKLSRAMASDTDSNVETVLITTQYGTFWSLGIDWITGNLYGVTGGGYIIACDGRSRNTETISCVTVVSNQGELRGIALRPDIGIMYWTRRSGYVFQGGMDGSNIRVLVSGLVQPAGILFDSQSNRLYWVEEDGKKIQSSNDQGSDVRTHVNTSERPFGIAILNGRLYWGCFHLRTVGSSTVTGDGIRVAYTAAGDVKQFFMPNWNRVISNKNHCELLNCPKVCVLTPTSARCLG